MIQEWNETSPKEMEKITFNDRDEFKREQIARYNHFAFG